MEISSPSVKRSIDRQLVANERSIAVSAVAGFVMFSLYYVLMQSVLRDAVLVDSDTLMHIAIGNWILQNGSFPTVDHFSYPTSGKTWFATDWISEVVFAGCFKIGGWWAVSQIAAVSAGLLAGGLTVYLTKRLRLSVALGLAAIIIALTCPHFLARPVLFSYVLILAWVIALLEIEDREMWTRPASYIFVPIMILWANIHGSFTFALATFYIFVCSPTLVAIRSKDLNTLGRLLALAVAVTLAAVATPYGILPMLRAIKLMSVPILNVIDEWHPPDFNDDRSHLVALVGLFGFLLYLGVTLRGPRLITLLLVTVLALEHRRGLGLFSLVAPLIVLRPVMLRIPWLAPAARDPVVRFVSTRSVAISTGSIAAVVAMAAASILFLPAPHPRVPEAALNAAIQKGVTGNVLNSYNFGGFLMFSGIFPFVDGRVAELHGNELLSRYFSAMDLSNTGAVDELVRQFDFQWALLHPTEPIIYKLRIDGWKELYRDSEAVVLIR